MQERLFREWLISVRMDYQYEVQHFISLEDVSREEVKWEEEQARCEARLQLLKRWKLLQIRFDEETKKAQRIEALVATAFARRVETIVANEEASRCEIAHTEHVRLEGILRFLDKRLREDILSAAYTIQQRLKYLNKTIDMVFKKEVSTRKALVGGERYAWLVMIQKFDAQTSKFLRQEVIDKVQQDKRAKHDRLKAVRKGNQKVTSVEGASVEESEGDHIQSDTRELSKSGRRVARKQRTVTRFLPEDFSKIHELLISKEISHRLSIEEDENRAHLVAVQLRNHLTSRDAEAHLPQTQLEIDLKFARRCQLVQREEEKGRQQVECEYDAGWLGMKRRLKRVRLGEAKVAECVQMRQLTHDSKLQARYQRIAHQQQSFAERERTAVADLAAVKQEVPSPLQTLSLVQFDVGRARRNLFVEEEDERRFVEQEHATLLHMLYGDMLREKCDGDLNEAKGRAAKSRREKYEKVSHNALLSEIEISNVKHASALEGSKSQKKLKFDIERIVRTEQFARVKVNLEVTEWFSSVHAQLRAVNRIAGTLDGLREAEARSRMSIKSQEKSGFATLMSFIHCTSKQQVKIPAPPLPLPPTNFEAAQRMYASFSASHSGRAVRVAPPAGRRPTQLPPVTARYKVKQGPDSVSPRRPSTQSAASLSRNLSPNLLQEIVPDTM